MKKKQTNTNTDYTKDVVIGERNNHLNRLLISFTDSGIVKDKILEYLLIFNQKYCKPPLPESEIRNMF